MVIAILHRQKRPKKLTHSQREDIKKENKKKKRKIRTKREESSEAN